MSARIPVLLLLIICIAGCGTRTIIVPVTRPALLDLHRCPRVLIATCDVSTARAQSTMDSSWFSADGIAEDVDAALPTALASTGQAEWVTDPSISGEDLFRTSGKVSGEAVERLRREYDASCILAIKLREARYDESMLSATIQSTVTPGSEKRVRQGRASLVLEVLLIDAAEGRVVFADSIRSDVSRETHASDKEPPEIDLADLQWQLVNQSVLRIAEATQPLSDHEVVTFLLDKDVPAIEHAIALAELGRWPNAVTLLDSLATLAGEDDGSDALWYNLGIARQYSGDFAGALRAFEAARRIHDSGRYRAAIDRLLRAEEEFLERRHQNL